MDHRTTESASAPIGHPGMEILAAFDPTSPFDSQCERLRREVLQIVIDSQKVTLYREMSQQAQLECLVAGLLTGLIGAAFASIQQSDDARDCIIEYIRDCMPVARRFADAMQEPSKDPTIT